MKQLLGIAALVIAMALPVFAQAQTMSPDDQAQFNSYYSRWVADRQSNNRDDMISMEHHMQDLMNKYQIPSVTPYDQVAAQNSPPAGQYDRAYPARPWQGRMSVDDQDKFNKEYSKWQDAKAKNDQDDIDKHARKMEEIMSRNNIPPNTPFDAIATANPYSSRVDYRQYQGKFSLDDQKTYDKAYEKWLKDRQRGDRDDVAKDEGKMQEVMARYNIPRDTPYDMLASGNRSY